MTKRILQEPVTPFYKEPLAWMLLLFPTAAVIWGVVMLSVAFKTKDSLVSDSYYKDGITYTENQAIDHHAKEAQITAALLFATSEVDVKLTTRLAEKPHTLQLKLIHPTLQDQDVDVFLQLMPNGHYKGALENANLGRRFVWLQSPEQQWRVRGEDVLDAGKTLTLSAR